MSASATCDESSLRSRCRAHHDFTYTRPHPCAHQRYRHIYQLCFAVLPVRLGAIVFSKGVSPGSITTCNLRNTTHALIARAVISSTSPIRLRRTLEEPNVRNRNRQFNMPHAFTTNARQRYFYSATIANHAFMFDALVFAASTFPVLGRTKNTLTKQTAFLRFKGPIVDRFWDSLTSP